MAESIEFQWPLREACTRELDAHCAGVPHGRGRVIRRGGWRSGAGARAGRAGLSGRWLAGWLGLGLTCAGSKGRAAGSRQQVRQLRAG